MQMSQSQGNGESIKLCPLLWELSHLSEMHKKFTTSDKLHNEEYFLIGLEHVFHTDQKWMISFLQDFLLEQSGLNLIIIEDDVLSQGLHGINSIRTRFLYEEYFTETAFSNYTFDDKIFEPNIFFILIFREECIGSLFGKFLIKLIDIYGVKAFLRLRWCRWIDHALRLVCWHRARTLFIWVVNVLLVESIFFLRIDFNTVCDVFFRSMILFKTIWNTINRKIYFISLKEDIF